VDSADRARYPSIADYALIGDCHTAALISRAGSVDWWCPGRFDRAAVLCRLLDAERGGCLSLTPGGRTQTMRQYRGATNVLETTFRTAEGQVRVTDYMPLERSPSGRREPHVRGSDRLVRLVEALSGEPRLELAFRPSFDYGRAPHELSILAEGGALARADGSYLALACPGVRLAADGRAGVRGQLALRAGERRWITLTHAEDEQRAREALHRSDGTAELERTLDDWERWAAGCTYRGPYRQQVQRSALTLKLLTYAPTGAVVAAPTTSLPEELGGVRNWDYRYTWLRDASLMLYALITVGYHDEAAEFFEWLERVQRANRGAVPQIMYAIDGGRELPEVTLDHLEGYRGSRPVRVGNAAADQRQLDVFGEVLGAAFLYFSHVDPRRRDPSIARPDGRPTPQTWTLLGGLVEAAARDWQQPDRGIWEVRGEPKLFLYSRLRCWAALDCGIRLAERYGLEAPLDRWHQTRRELRRAILSRGYDAARGAFTQAFGSPELDAGALAIPRLGFLPATDSRVQSTVERIRAELTHRGLVYRYRTADGLPGGEATFALCSYWLVDALALGGRLDEAHALFERVTGYANDLGLLAEEIDAAAGELLGNFPQGFSHMALIGAAVNLAKAARHGPEETAEDEAGRAGAAHRAAAAGHTAGRG
jgi:GH15 family glucan-1,4-alpha-glucosidase